jgi:hypothetical protein
LGGALHVRADERDELTGPVQAEVAVAESVRGSETTISPRRRHAGRVRPPMAGIGCMVPLLAAGAAKEISEGI